MKFFTADVSKISALDDLGRAVQADSITKP